MRVNGIAKNIAEWINKSERAQKVLKGINRNPAIFSAVTSFALASILRPTAIGLLPFSNKKDKATSQASAVSAGLVELGATAAIFLPLNKYIEETSKALFKSKGSFYEGNNIALRQFKSVTNRGFKLAFLIPVSLARFALVKPLMNRLFGDKKIEEIAREDIDEALKELELGRNLDEWA